MLSGLRKRKRLSWSSGPFQLQGLVTARMVVKRSDVSYPQLTELKSHLRSLAFKFLSHLAPTYILKFVPVKSPRALDPITVFPECALQFQALGCLCLSFPSLYVTAPIPPLLSRPPPRPSPASVLPILLELLPRSLGHPFVKLHITSCSAFQLAQLRMSLREWL